MKAQRLVVILTLLNAVLFVLSLCPTSAGASPEVAPVLRGRALEIVDEQGRVRASITVLPADPKVKMPGGTTGVPETVLLRLINSQGRPNIKAPAEVEAIVRERLAAAGRGDRAAWKRHISADCVWTGPGLVVGTTADAEREIAANPSLPASTFEIQAFEAHPFGNVVVATYVVTYRPVKGAEAVKRFRKIDTYLKEEGSWVLISASEVSVPGRVASKPDLGAYDSYAGRYQLDVDNVVKVWREGEKLLSQGTGEDKPTELLPAGGDEFFVDGEIGGYRFGRAEGGAVDRLIYHQEGSQDIVLRRIP